jgi:MFS family permease
MPTDSSSADAKGDHESRWLAFQHAGFPRYWLARMLGQLGVQTVGVSVAWQVYDVTRDPLDLGFVGLTLFVPSILLVLITGAASDRFARRTIMGICLSVEAVCAAALLVMTLRGLGSVLPIFGLLVVIGSARAFFGPAVQSLITNLVPPEHLGNAIAWNSSGWQTATIVGPVIGGLLYGIAPEAAYGGGLAMFVLAAGLILSIARPAQKRTEEPPSWETMVAGFKYIWREKIVLGAISLDLFAVLLGGATALLPVYARDILQLGPLGLGLLRAAPGVGAVLTAVWLTRHPVRDHVGVTMFLFVAAFGVFTLIFGFSTSPWLSVGALALAGAADMISVFIRQTLIQLWTPDAMRGRVNAVNMVFIGASNELGEFRAGVMAALIGTVAAVAVGGAGTIGVAALWARMFPELRRARHLDGRV